MEPRHWSVVADRLRNAAAACPDSYHAALAAGAALRLSERYDESVGYFTHSCRLRPTSANAHFALGRAHRGAGRRAEAIAAFQKAATLGAARAAYNQLCSYGARDLAGDTRPHVHALAGYEAFAALLAKLEAPDASPMLAIQVRIVPQPDLPEGAEVTLHSLRAQRYPYWTASIADYEACDAVEPGTWHLTVDAGTEFQPEALGWIAWAASATGADAVYADHDQFVLHAGGTRTRGAPILHPMVDEIWFSRPGCAPRLKARCTTAASVERVAHVPLVLATLPWKAEEQSLPGTMREKRRISVIIPTRDNPALLERCIETLATTAARPDCVELVIMDNGSTQPEAIALLARLAKRPATHILPFAAPFNWSRANNLGTGAAGGDHLLFLNDDTEMLTPGWDDILAGLLDETRVGVVGARMIYPDRTIQHAGFIFGMDNGPQHEGRWMPEDSDGPGGRWIATRQAAAVTGAFIAIRRDLFKDAGGFDEVQLAIDFADLDLCLKVRAMGKAVVYAGAITVLHHESVSRGFNRSRAKRRRVRREFDVFRARWGDAAISDPGYNPLWTREGSSFDGYVVPKMVDICRHVRKSAEANPWQMPFLRW